MICEIFPVESHVEHAGVLKPNRDEIGGEVEATRKDEHIGVHSPFWSSPVS